MYAGWAIESPGLCSGLGIKQLLSYGSCENEGFALDWQKVGSAAALYVPLAWRDKRQLREFSQLGL